MLKRRRVKWFKRIAIAAILVAGAGLGTAWMMFQHIPAWYRPVQVPPEYEQAVKDDFLRTQDNLREGLNASPHPFEYHFRQDQINAWLAKRDELWEFFHRKSRKWLPPSMSDPQVAIDPEGFRLAVTYRHRDVQTVLSAQFHASADTNGITLKLVQVAAGSLPIPSSRIQRLLARIDTHDWDLKKHTAKQSRDCPSPTLTDLFEGIHLPNAWTWQEGQRTFRIIQLRFEPGELVVTFEPLPRQIAVWPELIGRNSPGSGPAGSR